VSTTPPPPAFVGKVNSDLAFSGDQRDPGQLQRLPGLEHRRPGQAALVKDFVCPASQSDVSVYRNLLFVSGEASTGRLDCGTQGVPEPVSADRVRGIRIFDMSNPLVPKYVGNVQTCRGSHTHTVVTDPRTTRACVRLHVRVLGPCVLLRNCRAARTSPERGPELCVVPHRGDQGTAGTRRRRRLWGGRAS
jgi:hypothetical protein